MKDSSAFTEEIAKTANFSWVALMLIYPSIISNIPLKETISICVNLLSNNGDVIEGINKSEFENILSFYPRIVLYVLLLNKRAMWAWDHPQYLLWKTFSYRFLNRIQTSFLQKIF